MSRYRDTGEEAPTQRNPWFIPIITAISLLVLTLVAALTITVERIEGHQLGVMETWNGGVDDKVYHPKTYFLTPNEKMFIYDASSQVYVMNDQDDGTEKGEGRPHDAYLVQSSEGQDMYISTSTRWRRDPAHLVAQHKTIRNDVEEKVIRPVLMRIIKDQATSMKAIEAYSGAGLVQLQAAIEKALRGQSEGEGKDLAERGIFIEGFVIERIRLDPKYIEEIKARQIAVQKQLRSVEEQKAAEQAALVAKAEAQAGFERAVVLAKQEAEVTVTKAQADNEKSILAAKAEKEKSILEAEGKKMAQIAMAEGTLAMGKAEAEAKRLLLEAWAVPGAEAFVQVEVAKHAAEAFKGIQGYIPESMTINTLSGSFVEAVKAIATGKATSTP